MKYCTFVLFFLLCYCWCLAQCSLADANIVTSDFIPCNTPVSITFSAELQFLGEQTSYAYNWQFSDGTTSQEEQPTAVFVEPELYTATVIVTDLLDGCSVNDTYTFEIAPMQVLDELIRICASDSYQLPSGIFVDGAGFYTYQDVDEFGCPFITNTTLQVVQDYNFEIDTLTCKPFVLIQGTEVDVGRSYVAYGQTAEGCDSTVTFNVLADDQNVEINRPIVPNAFSPNGDQLNDVFRPIIQLNASTDIQDFRLRIFDRWGKELFFSDDPERGWDGTYRGEILPVGNYTWALDVGLLECHKIRHFQEGGNLMLVR